MTRASFAPLVVVVATALAACATKPKAPLEPAPPPITYVPDTTPATTAPSPPPAPATATPTPSPPPATATPTPSTAAAPQPASPPTTSAPVDPMRGNAPEISRSRGVKGGVVVLWPRIVPRNDTPEIQAIAIALQQRMTDLVKRSFPGRAYDVRPAPERACARGGCDGTAVGIVLGLKDGACAAIATVSRSGETPQLLLPWGGDVRLKMPTVPFREPPEAQIAVTDYVPCASLLADPKLAEREPAIVEAIRASL